MPRDSNGNYTLPAGNPVVTGTPIESAWANPTMGDIAAELTNSLDRQGRGGMLAPFKFADGLVGAPGMTFTSEPTLGFFRAGASDLRAVVGGVARMRWTGSGADVWNGSGWDALTPGNYVTLNTTQTITGAKTFTNNNTDHLTLTRTSNDFGPRIRFGNNDGPKGYLSIDDSGSFAFADAGGSNRFVVDTNGLLTVGTVPFARTTDVVSQSTAQTITGIKTFDQVAIDGLRVRRTTAAGAGIQFANSVGTLGFVAYTDAGDFALYNAAVSQFMRWGVDGELKVGTVPWARLSGTFGVGQTSQNLADFTSTDANVGRIFRALTAAPGSPGNNIAGVAMPFDGTPSTLFIGLTPDSTPRVYVGYKNGAAATPTWRELAYDNQVLKLTGGDMTGAISFIGSAISDLNTVDAPYGGAKLLRSGFQPANRPSANFVSGIEWRHAVSGEWRSQIVMDTDAVDPKVYVRSMVAASWGSWKRLAFTSEVVTLDGTQVMTGVNTFQLDGLTRFTRTTGVGNNGAGQAIMLYDDRTDRYGALGYNRGAASTRVGLSFYTSYDADPVERMRLTPEGLFWVEYLGTRSFQTQIHTASPFTTSAGVRHANGAIYDVGLNVMPILAIGGSPTLERAHVGRILQWNGNGSTLTTPNNSDTTIPISSVINVLLIGAGACFISGGSGVTLSWFNGAGAPTTGTRTIQRGSVVTLFRAGASDWYIWGAGIS